MIAFVGSVFSPAYFRARRRGLFADPTAHCGFNVAVHGPRGSAWAMSEYRGGEVQRGPDTLVLGRNRITRDDRGVEIAIDERTAPWGRALRGRVRLVPQRWMDRSFALDVDGRHAWWPVAPRATIEVELSAPELSFRGRGYHDSNAGSEPLERAIQGWAWSRSTDDVATVLHYDVTGRDGVERRIGLRYGDDGGVVATDPGPRVGLDASRWGLPRVLATTASTDAAVRRTLVDAPFYARSLVATPTALAMHETVDLVRFARPSTQLMLPFRIRGVGWW